MAKIDRFMIAPLDSGVETYLKPWLIPDDAFQTLTNAYVFRGRVRKRFGSYLMNQTVDDSVAQLYSRVRYNIRTTDAVTGNFSGFVPLNNSGNPTVTPAIGQMFAIGDTMFTVTALGNPAVLLTTGAATATYDTTTGAFIVVGNNENPLTSVYFYPSTPIMGFITYETGVINDEPLFAFDENFSYNYTTSLGWTAVTTENPLSPGSSQWSGDDSQFFWGSTWRGVSNYNSYMFVSNFNTPDWLRYWSGNNWNYLAPVLNNVYRLLTARIIVPFKNRLICLNTVENKDGSSVATSNGSTGNFTYTIPTYPSPGYIFGQTFICGTNIYTITNSGSFVTVSSTNNAITPVATATFVPATGVLTVTGNNTNVGLPVYFFPNGGANPESYVNRCRYSQNGNPTAPNGWLDSTPGLGGYIDAPTKEQIITAEFLKDRLIVYFETSTWELVYTGNQILPFVWQQINTELGCESTFSVVPFDKVALGVGNVGIHACNGSNVERIDEKIPDEVFKVSEDNEGVFRVYGIRDYYVEMVYWTFPSDNPDGVYPNRVLVYNYKTGSWAFNYDTITAFGYWQDSKNITWASSDEQWQQAESQWNSGILTSKFRNVIAGNQEGFIFIIDPDLSVNAPALQITNMTIVGTDLLYVTAINHNLQNETGDTTPPTGDYVLINNCQGITNVNGIIYEVYAVLDENRFVVKTPTGYPLPGGTYTGGGTVARVSDINIVTKQYNFYVQQGRNVAINKVDFLVDKTQNGQVVVDYNISSGDQSMTEQATQNNAIVGSGILETSPYLTYIYTGFSTDSMGNANVTLPFTFNVNIGSTFQVGNQIFTVVVANGALQTNGMGTGTYNIGTGVLTFTGALPLSIINVSGLAYPLEGTQDRLWHPVYIQADGECIQLNIYMNDAQMRNPLISQSDFQLHAMTFYSMPTSSRLQ